MSPRLRRGGDSDSGGREAGGPRPRSPDSPRCPPSLPQPGLRLGAPGKMWVKLCCLLLYFLALFVLARVFEAVAWYESGFLATQLVDPVALSFRKLRTILECRGLGHSGLPEKKDVRELVEKSGTRSSAVTRGDGERSVPGHPRPGSGRPWMRRGRRFPWRGLGGEPSSPGKGVCEGARGPRGGTAKARRGCEGVVRVL